ncbi:MAG: hypothetical protein PVG07_10320 [Acidobacteriota bacterium]|jgi:hypothetical protein
MTGEAPARVGVLLDGWSAPAWVHRVIESVQRGPDATLALVVMAGGAPEDRPGRLRRVWRRRSHWLYALYSRLDRRLASERASELAPERTDPFVRVPLDDLLAGVPVVRVEPRRTAHSDHFSDDALDAIRAHDLDVALRFGFRILRGGALGIARHGVWSYHHDDNRVIRGGPPGFWEVMEDRPVTGSMLQVLTERLDAGRVIYRSWSPTDRRSVHRNRCHVYWKSSAFVGRCLEALATTGDPAAGAAAEPEETDFHPYSGPLYRKPTNRRAAPLLARFATRTGREWLTDRLTRNQWFPAFAFDGEESGRPAPPELFRFRPILPPRDRFWADPFPVRQGGRYFIFLEEYLFRERRGRIAVLELAEDGRWTEPAPVLERPHHLSYPFVFRWREELFMVPESAEAGRIELLRCRSFPGEWEPEAVLLDGVRAVDATLHREGDRWWMFANLAEPGTAHCHDELHLFSAATPLGPWTPHPRNPVVSDARHARPAGALFRWGGDLYRPAQDCSGRYGSAVAIQRVLRLDPSGYREEPVSRIEPRWRPDLLATHTLNRAGSLTLVDGMRKIPRLGGATGASRPRRRLREARGGARLLG